MKFIFLIFLFAFPFSISNAQLLYWEKVFNQDFLFELKATKNGLLFGGRQGLDGILKSTDSGDTWVTTALNDVIYRIAFDNSNNIYAAQRYSPGIYRSTDNGNTWNMWYANAFRVRAMCITEDGYVFAGNEYGELYKSYDNGVSWISQSVTDKEISSILSIFDGKLFLSTLGRGIFNSTDYGETWTQINNVNLFNTIFSFTADSSDDLYAGHWDKISKSTDRGLTWELIGNFNISSESVLAVDHSNNIYYADHGVYKSTDSGITWSYLGGPYYIRAICFINNKIFLGTSDGIYRYDPYRPIYVGNNYLPLQTNNKWQYFGKETYYFQGTYYYNYWLNQIEVIGDSLINDVRYFRYINDWVRYSEADKKIYVWYNDSDNVHMNFTLIPENSFLQFPLPYNSNSIFNTHKNRIGTFKHGSTTLFNVPVNYKGFSYDTTFIGLAQREEGRYSEGIGLYYYSNSTHNLVRQNTIIMAVLYDSLGNPIEYSNRYKPQISLSPITTVNSSNFNMTFLVAHHYTISGMLNFLDSVYLESYYQKNDSIVYKQNVFAQSSSNFLTHNVHTTLDTTLLKNNYSLYYRVVAKDKGIIQETSYSPDTGYYKCVWDFSTSVDDEAQPVDGFALHQNYPNPFNPSTVISYQLPVSGHVTLKVLDILGREVATLIDEYKEAGYHEVEFQSAVGSIQLASGIYYYQLKAGEFVETKKMMVIR